MEIVERTFSYLFKGVRNHDAGLFTRTAAFASFSTPNIEVTSPDCGPSNEGLMDVDHTQDGKDLLPTLNWSISPAVAEAVLHESIKEWLIVIEDVDAPLPKPIMHAAFFGIPASVRKFAHEDLDKEEGKDVLKSGVGYGKNLRNKVYAGPKPLKGHGKHRYFYQVIALGEPLDRKAMSPVPKKDELVRAVEGKVLGWGAWIGIAERP